jgi:hypothetical protein
LTPANLVFAEPNLQVDVGRFSLGILDQWRPKSFFGETSYQLVWQNNNQVLRAISNNSASGLFKQQRIDLLKTPYLNWQWRIENHLGNINEQSKSGDDYPARIYIVIDGGLAFWRTKAINYVWASNSAKDKIWPNAFAGDNAMMVALRSKNDATGTWFKEKRNILQDLQLLFGKHINYIDAIAIMTDTDNAKGSAIAYYGDIYFSKD